MKRAGLALVLSLWGCRGGESEDPPVHLIHNMDTQEKGKAYRVDTSGVFKNGRLMQMPIEGTVAVGHLADDSLFDDGIDPDPLTFDGGRLGQPAVAYRFPAQVMTDGGIDEAFIARGKLRYDIYCTPCHGATLDGKGPVAGKALDGGARLEVPPRDLVSAVAKEYPAGQLYQAIKVGVNNGNMAGYAAQIPTADRWAITAYVMCAQGRSLDGKPPAPEAAPDPKGPPSVALGRWVWKQRGCNACHSIDGTRIVGPTWLGVWGKSAKTAAGEVMVDEAYIKESIVDPKAKVREGYPPIMPPPATPMTDSELKSVSLFIESLKQ